MTRWLTRSAISAQPPCFVLLLEIRTLPATSKFAASQWTLHRKCDSANEVALIARGVKGKEKVKTNVRKTRATCILKIKVIINPIVLADLKSVYDYKKVVLLWGCDTWGILTDKHQSCRDLFQERTENLGCICAFVKWWDLTSRMALILIFIHSLTKAFMVRMKKDDKRVWAMNERFTGWRRKWDSRRI
jgi:hypothetical protein